jgi:hypothetical protein
MATEDQESGCTASPERQDGDALIGGHSWSDTYYLIQDAQIYTIRNRSGTPTTTLSSEQLEAAGLEPGDPIVMMPRQDDCETLFEVVAPPEDVGLSRPPQAFQALLGGCGTEAVGAQSD